MAENPAIRVKGAFIALLVTGTHTHTHTPTYLMYMVIEHARTITITGGEPFVRTQQ